MRDVADGLMIGRRVWLGADVAQACRRMRAAGIGAKVVRVHDGAEIARCVSAQADLRPHLREMGWSKYIEEAMHAKRSGDRGGGTDGADSGGDHEDARRVG